MTEAMMEELRTQGDGIFDAPLDSVYFGGGTPSLFPPKRIGAFVQECERLFGIKGDAEITLEANPDDLYLDRLKAYREAGVNRLSIGVQSFDDELLKRCGRPHDGAEAERSLERVSQVGYESYSADLIFGIPGSTLQKLERDLDKLIEHQVPHISTYGLTIEAKTAFAHWIEKGRMQAPDEELLSTSYERIMDRLQECGYQHYEISNFALPTHRAVHNSSYWTGEPYLGIGPSAHSFDGVRRWWNVSKNFRYMRSIKGGMPEREMEEYDPLDRANERMMTRLRTDRGLDPKELRTFGVELRELRKEELQALQEEEVLYEEAEQLRLTRKGKLVADRVIERLFLLKDDR